MHNLLNSLNIVANYFDNINELEKSNSITNIMYRVSQVSAPVTPINVGGLPINATATTESSLIPAPPNEQMSLARKDAGQLDEDDETFALYNSYIAWGINNKLTVSQVYDHALKNNSKHFANNLVSLIKAKGLSANNVLPEGFTIDDSTTSNQSSTPATLGTTSPASTSGNPQATSNDPSGANSSYTTDNNGLFVDDPMHYYIIELYQNFQISDIIVKNTDPKNREPNKVLHDEYFPVVHNQSFKNMYSGVNAKYIIGGTRLSMTTREFKIIFDVVEGGYLKNVTQTGQLTNNYRTLDDIFALGDCNVNPASRIIVSKMINPATLFPVDNTYPNSNNPYQSSQRGNYQNNPQGGYPQGGYPQGGYPQGNMGQYQGRPLGTPGIGNNNGGLNWGANIGIGSNGLTWGAGASIGNANPGVAGSPFGAARPLSDYPALNPRPIFRQPLPSIPQYRRRRF